MREMAKRISKPNDEVHDGIEAATNGHCVSCVRQIDRNTEGCPYCGHDFRQAISAVHMDSPLEEKVEGEVRSMCYSLSVLFPIAGFFIGGYLMSKPSSHVHRAGKICMIL